MKIVLASAFIATTTLTLGSAARADDAQQYGYSCEQVRAFVSSNGKVKALALAIENGATWAQISAAKRCLKAAVMPRWAQS